jgi:hypothetical protein
MREAAGGRDAGPEEQAHQTDGRAQSHARAGPRGQVSTPVAVLLEAVCQIRIH